MTGMTHLCKKINLKDKNISGDLAYFRHKLPQT